MTAAPPRHQNSGGRQTRERTRDMARDTQLRILFAVEYCWAQHGFAPTIRELADAAELHHTTVMRWLDRLRARGVLTFEDGKARTIRLTETGRRHVNWMRP